MRLSRVHLWFVLLALGALTASCGHYERQWDGKEYGSDSEEGSDDDEDLPPIQALDDDDDDDAGDDDGGTPVPNWSWVNDAGETVELYDFMGSVVMLNAGAGWCVPCREEAPLLESDLYQEYRDEGFEIIELLVEDNQNNPPSQEFLQGWRSEYGLTYTICADPAWTLMPYFTEGSLPFTLFLDRAMVPRSSRHGYDKAVYQGVIEQLLE